MAALREYCIGSIVLAGAVWVLGCSGDGLPSARPAASPSLSSPATHVGRDTCAECHAAEAAAWQGSHHDLAMQPAVADTVLGDFDDATFEYAGVTTTLFRDGQRFMARTDGPDGRLTEFEIAYTFGVEPLQQYLVELDGGRLQALNVVWDTRPASAGGQRWFHLYPAEAVDHADILHWTGPLQNWNYMCAECHSTNLRKNYDAVTNRYATTWSEIDVSCEACHGPGSRHVDQARAGTAERGADMGLVVQLADTDGGAWVFDPGAVSARREPPRTARAQVEACARCHARRAQLTDDYVHGRPLADTHRVSLLDESLYHADGQILDEVYVYGSFLQSKMYHGGVTCTDCHDPHTARLRLPGNATCATCHRQDTFNTAQHHFHPQGSTGASCVACHMPERDYMVVDPRHDHGFRIPRPDLSVSLGLPNTCTDCHADRDARWAADAVADWYGDARSTHFAAAIHAGRTWQASAPRLLTSVIEDPAVPAIARATALTLLRSYLTPAASGPITSCLDDVDPLVRFAAVGTLEWFDPAVRKRLALPLLDDPIRMVRLEAARVLASVPRAQLSDEQRAALDRGLDEYAQVQQFNADRAEGRLNLGWLHWMQGKPGEAEEDYRQALEQRPSFAPAAVNLVDLYRVVGRDRDGEAILREALLHSPNDPDLHHALGLWLVRQRRHEEALALFERAVELAPHTPGYAYFLGVALHSTGSTPRALEVMQRAHEEFPGHADLLFMLAAVSRDVGDVTAARQYATRLTAMLPDHPGANALLKELNRG